MDSFKDSYLNLYGPLMQYKEDDRREQEASAIQVTNEYRQGNCDPGRFTKRYEVINDYMKRKQLVQNIKEEVAKAISLMPPTIAQAFGKE